MIVLRARNVHEALPLGVDLLQREGVRRPSRYGVVYEHPEPVTTVYERPCERVVFWPARDANPFFHLFECLHMLAGRRDVAWLAGYNARMREFSDDGVMFHGAYGYRWRKAFGFDQLVSVADVLRQDPASRRAVLQMWHAPLDLNAPSKDLPCNTHVYFKIRDGALLMTVCCRSNDIVWGAYGANAVHFSFVQEYLADQLGVAAGAYTQVSDSFHAYEGVWEKVFSVVEAPEASPYHDGAVTATRLNAADPAWLADLASVFAPAGEFTTEFFRGVIAPLRRAHAAFRRGQFAEAFGAVDECAATDWALAARQWLNRRPSFTGVHGLDGR